MDPTDVVIEKVKQREVACVFHSPEALDGAVKALLHQGFDRADIDFMASQDAVREKLGGVYIAAQELPDVPRVPRQAYIARDDVGNVLSVVVGLLLSVGALATTFSIVASGGALAVALGAAAVGSGGAVMVRLLGRERAKEPEAEMAKGGLVLWVRLVTPSLPTTAISPSR